MAYSGKREGDGLHAITLKPVISEELADNLFKKLFLTGSISSKSTISTNNNTSSKIPSEIVQENVTRNEEGNEENVKITLSQKMREKFMDFKQSLNKELPKSKHRETMISKIFREYYGPFLLDCFTKKVFIFIYIIYLSLAILGCTMLKE
ncbi:unnamed protein product, partial [Brugia pahangi]|uniref:Uncharacterized protein n=1 Tax=Brugia pahangi TaxID=6280 RepID=A0A0N4THI0_BRUPA